jgi:4-methylaminobutanoate oxidase (formaldehyde-forming)
MTAQEITVANVPVRAVRVTFVGEHGWEIYAASEYGAGLWQALWSAGAEHGLMAGGYRAIESLRLEKGYRVWGTDITAETTPYEAGLGFCVKLDKPEFEGRDALEAAKERGLDRRLCAIVLDDPRKVVLGSEPVSVAGRLSGRVTSGGYGYTVERSIAYAYLQVDDAEPGTAVTIDIFGEPAPGAVVAQPVLSSGGRP